MEEETYDSREIMGKTIVSKTGKKFGTVGDVIFETKSGELIHLVLINSTPNAQKLQLEKDSEGNLLVPFSSVIAIGDVVVISEEDII